MRSVEELQEFANEYDESRVTPYSVPEEYELEGDPLNISLLPLFRKKSNRPSPVCCPSAPVSARNGTEDGGGCAFSPPADNMGFVKYRETFGGFDGGVEAGYDGSWDELRFDQLKTKLDVCKQAADDGDLDNSMLDFGGVLWKVLAKGTGGQGVKYKYVMEHFGIKLYVHSNARGGIQPVRIRFGSQCLQRVDLYTAADRMVELLAKEGFTISVVKLSRVDCQVMMERPLQDFVEAMSGEKVITLCRGKVHTETNLKTGKIETITVKSANQELCIYNKREEIVTKDKESYEIFRRYVLDCGELPADLTRVEFRFRRDALKRYGINTFQDLKDSIHSLLMITSSEWFRILAKDKVRGSENTQAVAPVWIDVVNRFDYYFNPKRYTALPRSPQDLKVYKPPKDGIKVDRLVKQAGGLIASFAAFCMDKAETVDDVLAFAFETFKRDSAAIGVKFRRRVVDRFVSLGYSAASDVHNEFQDIRKSIEESVFLKKIGG
jgi:hypothetical protein